MGDAPTFLVFAGNDKGVFGEMKNDFLLAITQLAAERNLPKELVLEAVKAALLSTYKNYDVSIDILSTSGEIKAYATKTVVEAPNDNWHEITLSDAQKIQKDIEPGQTINIEIDPLDAGRIGVQTAKQVVMQRLREAEHEFIFGTFAHREGNVLSGVVQRVDARHILVDLGQAEGLLPLAEQVRAENYRVGQRLKVYLVEVSQTNKGPRLLLSRTHPRLVQRLFELEVPEISNGVVEVKAIAREAGFRTKVAVAAKQGEIDPVGSCIGLRGIRIQNVTNEIQGEKIDVIEWAADIQAFIANALSPAKVTRVKLDPLEGTAIVIVPDGQLSLAIGREGQNARLAAKLTEWKIDIKSVSAAADEGLLVEEAPAVEEELVVAEPPVEDVGEIVEVEEVEIEEEITSGAPVIEVELPVVKGPKIRFAEDILPASARIGEDTDKSKKKKSTVGEKAKGKKKVKRKIVVEDVVDDDMDDADLDFDLGFDDSDEEDLGDES